MPKPAKAPVDPDQARDRQFWVAKAVLEKLKKLAKETGDSATEARAQAALSALLGKTQSSAAA